MEQATFLKLILNPNETFSSEEVAALEQLAHNFPYCQAAHLLLAKDSHSKGSMLYNQKLKKASVYAINRRALYYLIHSAEKKKANPEPYFINIALKQSEETTPVSSPSNHALLNEIEINLRKLRELRLTHQTPPPVAETSEKEIDTTESSATKDIEVGERITKAFEKEDQNNNVTPEKTIDIVKPLAADEAFGKDFERENINKGNDFETLEKTVDVVEPPATQEPIEDYKVENIPQDDFETISYLFPERHTEESRLGEQVATYEDDENMLLLDYLKFTHSAYKPDSYKAENQNVVIENFLKKEPKISRPDVSAWTNEQPDLTKESVEPQILPVTETYASILARQGKTEKAKEIYEKLILKYPDKKTYFASKIDNLEKK